MCHYLRRSVVNITPRCQSGLDVFPPLESGVSYCSGEPKSDVSSTGIDTDRRRTPSIALQQPLTPFLTRTNNASIILLMTPHRHERFPTSAFDLQNQRSGPPSTGRHLMLKQPCQLPLVNIPPSRSCTDPGPRRTPSETPRLATFEASHLARQ